MRGPLTDILLVLVFILIGGVFSASEIALVSLREGQVRQLEQRGKRGRRVAALSSNPNRFLAAVQVGVTLAGFLSAAFGASTLAARVVPVLERLGLGSGLASVLALVGITLIISYVSLVLGELAPKRIALQRTEAIVLAVAPTVDRIARLTRPVIWLLSVSTDAVVRVLGGDPRGTREEMSEAEIRDIVTGATTLGSEERRLIGEVFGAGERQLHEIMVPRTEVSFLDASLPVFKAVRLAAGKPHSRYPVARGSQDEVVGFVHVRDLFDPNLAGRSVRVGDLARPVKMLPGTVPLLAALSEMRRERHHLAIVVDEYGGTDGIVTLEDLVEELVGDIRDEYDVERAGTRRLGGGDIELDGLLSLDDVADVSGLRLPDGPYETVAGYVLAQLGRMAAVGDEVHVDSRRLTVTELDGRRIARLRVSAPRAPGSPLETADVAGRPSAQAPAAAMAPVGSGDREGARGQLPE